jgi:hypothetical protein
LSRHLHVRLAFELPAIAAFTHTWIEEFLGKPEAPALILIPNHFGHVVSDGL